MYNISLDFKGLIELDLAIKDRIEALEGSIESTKKMLGYSLEDAHKGAFDSAISFDQRSIDALKGIQNKLQEAFRDA